MVSVCQVAQSLEPRITLEIVSIATLIQAIDFNQCIQFSVICTSSYNGKSDGRRLKIE